MACNRIIFVEKKEGFNVEGKLLLEDLAKCEPIYEEFEGWDE